MYQHDYTKLLLFLLKSSFTPRLEKWCKIKAPEVFRGFKSLIVVLSISP